MSVNIQALQIENVVFGNFDIFDYIVLSFFNFSGNLSNVQLFSRCYCFQ